MSQAASASRGSAAAESVYMRALFKLNHLRILTHVGLNNRHKCFYFPNLGKTIFKSRLLDCLIFSSFYKWQYILSTHKFILLWGHQILRPWRVKQCLHHDLSCQDREGRRPPQCIPYRNIPMKLMYAENLLWLSLDSTTTEEGTCTSEFATSSPGALVLPAVKQDGEIPCHVGWSCYFPILVLCSLMISPSLVILGFSCKLLWKTGVESSLSMGPSC